MTDRELLNRAKDAAARSYSPYSKFAVGAALECEDGTVFTGCNVENVSFGLTICAERTALVKAISEGYTGGFRRIAISAESADYCLPCGACRQVIAEFCGENMEVLCSKSGGRYVSYRMSQLLPKAFTNFAPADEDE